MREELYFAKIKTLYELGAEATMRYVIFRSKSSQVFRNGRYV